MLSKNMVIDDILYKYPQLETVFKEHGIKCFGWGGALYMTVEQAALRYRVDAEELVDDLNKNLQ